MCVVLTPQPLPSDGDIVRDWKNLAALSCSAPWKPRLVPPEPGSKPVLATILSPPSCSPYSSEDDPYPDFTTHSLSPCSGTESCCDDTSFAVAWEKSMACEICVRRCRLGHLHGLKMDERSKLGRGWMRHIFHNKTHHV
jgi:hypothetical protein